ncbi:MAG: SEFIR domain-containing protein, partial [Verrucomicrobiota bacterium]
MAAAFSEDRPPRVLISYSHDSENHRDRVRNLADRLRAEEGIDCVIDQYFETPDPEEGWPRWMMNRVEWADFILVTATVIYDERFRGKNDTPCVGRGVDWEGVLITNELYDAKSKTIGFVPIVFAAEDRDHVPLPLRQRNCYLVSDEYDYESLNRHIRDEPRHKMPGLSSKPSKLDLDGHHRPKDPDELHPSIQEELERRRNAFLDQIESDCRIKEGDPEIKRMSEPDRPEYLHVVKHV